MRKLFTTILTITLATLLLAQSLTPAFADGMIWEYDDTSDEWNLLPETKQRAYINHEDGIQKMLLTVNAESLAENETVWIFPVPALPDKTVIDVMEEFPETRGTNLNEKAKENLILVFEGIRFTQLYYVPLFVLAVEVFDINPYRAKSMRLGYGSVPLESAAMEDVIDVEVYEHLEKLGLTTELITAKTAEGLENYFGEKGLTLPKESKDIIDEYIGEDYSFVVSWKEKVVVKAKPEAPKPGTSGDAGEDVEEAPAKTPTPKLPSISPDLEESSELISDSSESEAFSTPIDTSTYYVVDNYTAKDRELSVYVSFPADEMFFPLLPTSVYGSKEIPVWIYVSGMATPDTFEDIEPYTTTDYYYDSYFYEDSKEFKNFFGIGDDAIRDFIFTKITIEAPSKLFTEDLWIDKGAPLITHIAKLLINDWGIWIFGIFMLLIFSCLASLFAGLIAFHGTELPKKWKLPLMGLWNILTFIGFLFANIYMKTKKVPQALEAQLEAEKSKVIIRDRRKILYAILFAVFFLAISAIVEIGLFYSL